MKFADLRRMTIAAYLDSNAHEWSLAFDANEELEPFESAVIAGVSPFAFIVSAKADMSNWPACEFGQFARRWIARSDSPSWTADNASWVVDNAIGHLISAVVYAIHDQAQTAHGRMRLKAELLRLEGDA